MLIWIDEAAAEAQAACLEHQIHDWRIQHFTLSELEAQRDEAKRKITDMRRQMIELDHALSDAETKFLQSAMECTVKKYLEQVSADEEDEDTDEDVDEDINSIFPVPRKTDKQLERYIAECRYNPMDDDYPDYEDDDWIEIDDDEDLPF